MHLIYLWAPFLFFLFSVIEVILVPNKKVSWTESNYRKSCVIKPRTILKSRKNRPNILATARAVRGAEE